MSAIAPALTPPPPPPRPTAPPPPPALKPVAVPPPRIWVGFVIASICLAGDIAGWILGDEKQGLILLVTLPLSLLGWIYWLFSIYRLHQILARATGSQYPISAWRAVGLYLVPIYSWVWRYRWGSQMANFANLYSPRPARTDVPLFLLFISSAAGFSALMFACTSLRLFLLFSVALLFTRRIRRVVVADVLHLARRKQIDLALTAGLGAALGFLFVRALVDFKDKPWFEQVADGIGIVLLSLFVVRIIEPLRERISSAFGVEVPHPLYRGNKPWLVRTAIFLALASINFFHDVVHDFALAVARNFAHVMARAQVQEANSAQADLQVLLVGLLVSGGITYFWISGIRQEPRRAARFGAVSGAGIALFSAFIIGVIADPPKPEAAASTAPQESSSGPPIQQIVAKPSKQSVESVASAAAEASLVKRIRPVPFADISSAGTNALAWGLLGMVGGLLIDRKRGGLGIGSFALGIICSAVLLGVGWVFWSHTSHGEQMMKLVAGLTAVGGWCLGLALHPATPVVFGPRQQLAS